MQWDNTQIASSGLSLNFPIAFPNKIVGYYHSHYNYDGSADTATMAIFTNADLTHVFVKGFRPSTKSQVKASGTFLFLGY